MNVIPKEQGNLILVMYADRFDVISLFFFYFVNST